MGKRKRTNHHPIELLEPRRLLAVIYGPDPAFGVAGTAYVPASGHFFDFLPDGKILAAGTRQDPTYSEDLLLITTVTRLNPDGTSDLSFGPSGIRDDGNESYGGTLSADKLRYYLEFDGENNAHQIHAFDTNADLVPAFSGDGILPIPSKFPLHGDYDDIDANFIAALPDGSLLLDVQHEFDTDDYATSPRYRQIVKLKPNGDIDTAFGDDGFIVFEQNFSWDKPGSSFAITWTTGGILRYEPVTAGETPTKITRYQQDGVTIDTTFGAAGSVTVNDGVPSITEQPDGKLLLLFKIHDEGQQGSKFRLTRLSSDGSIDTSFGAAGSVVMTNPDFKDPYSGDNDDEYAYAQIALDDQNRITALAGNKLYRFSATGQLAGFPFDGSQTLAGLYDPLIDDAGRLLVSNGYTITRYDVHDDITLGRDGVVYVTAPTGDHDDTVTTALAGDQITVALNGDTKSFDAADVTGFTLYLSDGENTATSTLDLPVKITSGDDHDVYTTGGGSDSITSNGGGDSITCGNGDDTLRVGKYENTTEHHTITGQGGDKDIEIAGGIVTITLGVGDSHINTAYEDGHNEITIAGGSNTVSLDGENDVLVIGGDGDNYVQLGGKGGATVTTGGGADTFKTYTSGTIHSGGGDDYFDVTALFDAPDPLLVFAGDGNDRLVIPFTSSTYNYHVIAHGGDGDDRLLGGHGTQYFYGGAGKDTLRGGDGSDLLCGGGGNDRIFGDGGNDRLYARAGRDYLNGGGGNDRAFGDADRDIVYGAMGDDTLDGGGTGDLIYGQAGADQLTGGGGDDRLNGGDDPDTLHGNAGDDLFVTVDTVTDQLFGDAGEDLSYADSSDSRTGIESRDNQLPATPAPAVLTLKTTSDEIVLPFTSFSNDADIAADGSYIIASATNDTVQAIRYSPAGEQIGEPITIATRPDADHQFAEVSVSSAANGDSVVMYRISEGPPYYGIKSSAYFVIISSTGDVSDPILLDDSIDGEPSVSMADDGSFFVTWPRLNTDFSESILVRAFDSSGLPLSAAFPIPEGDSLSLSISARPDGLSAVLAWTDQGEYNNNIRFARVSRTAIRGTPGAINLDPLNQTIYTHDPALAVQPDGSFAIAYADQNTAFIQRYDSDGHAKGLRAKLLPDDATGAIGTGGRSISADILPGGEYAVVFRDWGENGDKEIAYVRRFNATLSDSALLTVSTHSVNFSSFQFPALATNAAGNAVLLYTTDQILLRRLTTG